MPQRFDRVHQRGSPRGINPKQDTDTHGNGQGQDHGPGGDARLERIDDRWQQIREGRARRFAKSDKDRSTQETEGDTEESTAAG